jgi:hypothetical protein
MISAATGRATALAVSVILACLIGVTTAAAVSAHGAGQPQRRQIAATTLTSFRVVLTATRGGPGHRLQATVTAAGYRRAAGHWKLIATRRVGKVNGWFWFSVEPCSLTATQLANNTRPSPPVIVADSMKVSLLITPAIGCSRGYRQHWKP